MSDNYTSYTLSISQEFELALFSKAFIEKYSPEVLGSTPPIMFFSNNFEALHNTISNVGDIVEHNEIFTFNFPDPEGNYFVMAKAKKNADNYH